MAINQSELTEILKKGMEDAPSVAEEVNDEEAKVTEEEVSQSDEEVVEVQEETAEVTEEVQDEAAEIESLSELAEAIEVDPEWLYGIKVPISDGRDPISLSELKDQYQEYSRVNDLKAQLELEQAEFQEKMKAREGEIESSLQQFQNMPQELMAAQAESMSLAYQYNNFDWATLEQENPGQAALAKQNLATAYQQSQEKVAQVQAKIGSEVEQRFRQNADKEKRLALKHIPDWIDEDKRLSDQNKIKTMLKEYGYSDDESGNIVDHRALRLAYDLLNLKTKIKDSKKVVKKLNKVPRVVKPGAAPAPKSKSDISREIVSKAAKSKNQDVKVRAIGDLILNQRG